jgi:hypothetical protein
MNTAVGTSVDMAETGTPLRLLSLRAAGALFGAAQLGCEY